jgi:hypothetical protein
MNLRDYVENIFEPLEKHDIVDETVPQAEELLDDMLKQLEIVYEALEVPFEEGLAEKFLDAVQDHMVKYNDLMHVNRDLRAKIEAHRQTLNTLGRRRLPDTREGVTRKFKVQKTPHANVCPSCQHRWEESGEMKIYATVSCFPEDGKPGELFLTVDRLGSTAHGALNAAAILLSVGLQYGIDLKVFTSKLRGMVFGPGGLTGDPEFRRASSVLDLIAQWLEKRFLKEPTGEYFDG